MHQHDQGCGWIHREFPEWRGCGYRVDCAGEPAELELLGRHDSGRRFRLRVEVCRDHRQAVAEFAGADRYRVLGDLPKHPLSPPL